MNRRLPLIPGCNNSAHVITFLVQLPEKAWEDVWEETYEAASNWDSLCELTSLNNQKKENSGLRRFLVNSDGDLRNQCQH